MKTIDEIIQHPPFDLKKVRKDFAYLEHYPDLAYLDNAATTQRPKAVIEGVAAYYAMENGNPLRGNHKLSHLSTLAYEEAREKVKRFIGASEKEEIIFTRNATESLNLLAYSLGDLLLKEGDEVLITRMEHHSNSVNWQKICKEKKAKLVYVDLTEDLLPNEEDLKKKLTQKVKIFSFTGASNVLGTVTDVKRWVLTAKEKGIVTIVDGAQLVAHEKVDVKDLDCDFLAFSGHKMLAPFGIGVLYGKRAMLEKMPPFLYGGEMIEYVYDDYSTFAPLPYKFEAGTQNVGSAVGLGLAIDYLEEIGMEKIEQYEKALADYVAKKLRAMDDIDVYRPKGDCAPVVAFNFKNAHPHDVSTILDFNNVAIRSGHHCAQQLHRYLNINASCRASFSFYNTKEEVDRFILALQNVRDTMGM